MAPGNQPTQNPGEAVEAPEQGQESTEVATNLPPTLSKFLEALTAKIDESQKEPFIKAVSAYFAQNESYPSATFRALVGHTYEDDLLTQAIDAALSNVSDYGDVATAFSDVSTPDKLEAAMVKFKSVLAVYELEVVKMRQMQKEKDKLLALKASYQEMSDHDQVPADVQSQISTLTGDIDTYLNDVIFVLDKSDDIVAGLTAKRTSIEPQLKQIFVDFKTAKVTELSGKKAPADKVTALQVLNDPKAFLDELSAVVAELEIDAAASMQAPPAQPTTQPPTNPPATPPATPPPADAPSLMDPGAMAEYFAQDLQKTSSLSQTLMNMSELPLIGWLFKMLATYMRDSNPESFEKIQDTETDEYFIDLLADGEFKHKTYEAVDTTWQNMRGYKLRATYWLEKELRIDGKEVGPKRNVVKAIFNSEFTVGEFKELAKKGDNPSVIEEEDLPNDLMDDLDIVRGVYNEVITAAGNTSDWDSKTVAELVASELYTDPGQSTAG